MKKSTPLDKLEFQNTVNALEASQNFRTRSELFQAIAETAWAKSLRTKPLSGAFFAQRAALFLEQGSPLVFKTPLGKRGGDGNFGGKRGTGRGRTAGSKKLSEEAKKYFGKEHDKMTKTIEKAAAGSLSNAVKLHCLECSCGSKSDVANCVVKQCALWGFRPWQSSMGKNSDS